MKPTCCSPRQGGVIRIDADGRCIGCGRSFKVMIPTRGKVRLLTIGLAFVLGFLAGAVTR